MKQIKYTHIKKAERHEIAILLQRGYGLREVAGTLKRSAGTVSEEISKNIVNGAYDPEKADHKAYVKRKYSKYQGMKVEGNDDLRNYIEEKIKEDWSPEEISGRIREVDSHIAYVSYQGIYRYIYSVYGRQIEQYLRYGRQKRNKYDNQGNNEKTLLENRVFIDQRPKIVGKRVRYGDWEGDFIVSGKNGKGVLLVLHERKSRFPMIERIMSKNPETVNRTIYERTGILINFNSLTLDNDIVFKKHLRLSKIIGAPVYFCHPYHSWEKGGVENTNKLIRQYVPKRTDISTLNDEYIREIEQKLMNRPRKCLNYKTPLEVMIQHKQFKILENFGITINQNQAIKKQAGVRLEG